MLSDFILENIRTVIAAEICVSAEIAGGNWQLSIQMIDEDASLHPAHERIFIVLCSVWILITMDTLGKN